MVLVCPGCKNQITLDDASVPEGVFKVRCTGCGKIITSQRSPEQQTPRSTTSGVSERRSVAEEGISPALEAFVKKQIAIAKKEIIDSMGSLFRGTAGVTRDSGDYDPDSQKALICSGDPATLQSLALVARNMGYIVETAVTVADSLKSLEDLFSLVVIDSSFSDDSDGARKLISKLNISKGPDRRKILVTLVSPVHKTLDGNAAFMNGVNLILNKSDLNAAEASIQKCRKDLEQTYSIFLALSEEKAMSAS